MIETERMSCHDGSRETVFCRSRCAPWGAGGAAGAESITVCRIGGPCGWQEAGVAGSPANGRNVVRSSLAPHRHPLLFSNVAADDRHSNGTIDSILFGTVGARHVHVARPDSRPARCAAADARRPARPVGHAAVSRSACSAPACACRRSASSRSTRACRVSRWSRRMSGWSRTAIWIRGAAPGFYVRERLGGAAAMLSIRPHAERAPAPSTIDVVWLLRNMLHTGARPEQRAGPRLSAGALARRRTDHQRAAHARPAKRRADARLRHAAGFSAAAPAIADAARRTGDRRVAGPDRDGVRRHAGDRPDRAHLRAAGRHGDRRRSGVVPDVRALRVAGRAAGRHAVHAGRPRPRRARIARADVAAEDAGHQLGAAKPDRHVADGRAGVPHPAARRSVRLHRRRGRYLRRSVPAEPSGRRGSRASISSSA